VTLHGHPDRESSAETIPSTGVLGGKAAPA
jgi:hypothetical protein